MVAEAAAVSMAGGGLIDDTSLAPNDLDLLMHFAVRVEVTVSDCATWCFLSAGEIFVWKNALHSIM